MLGTNKIRYNGRLVGENSDLAFQEKCRHMQKINADLLSLLRRHQCRVTFFITGRMYEAIPAVIDAIANDGHEIAWHGHFHRPLIDAKALEQDLDASERFLQKFKPKGFRAPWVMFRQSNLRILKQAGFAYDSSCYDSAGRRYEADGVKIFPVTGLSVKPHSAPPYVQSSRYWSACRVIPIGSNFFFSVLRDNYRMLFDIFQKQDKGCILYLHNWQIFPWPERELALWRDGLRYLQKFPLAAIVENLINDYQFLRLDALLAGRPNGHYLTFDSE